MGDRAQRSGIAEVTIQAYARRHGIEEERPRCWRVRTRMVVMTIICTMIASLIVYWFVSSLLDNRGEDGDEHRNGKSSSKKSYLQRLSKHVVPTEYNLRIIPVLEEGNFTIVGDVEILFDCKVPTNHIRLHGRNLTVKEIDVKEYYYPDVSRKISKYVLSGDNYIDIFLLQVLMPSENYVLQVKYTAPLLEEPRGLFRSAHYDSGKLSWIALSIFSPDFARRAFPCFDEPWAKAPFRISIGRKASMQSHSNAMRKMVENIPNMEGYVWDHYEKTLPISTYLVALMVTDFSSYNVSVRDRPSHAVYSRREVLKNTEYLGHLIPKLVRVMQSLTGFYYEPDKLDVMVVPNYLYVAMENWGLITFREDYGVISNKSNEMDQRRMLAEVAGHEVAHQWFGNLVTPKWWSNVWLKEGFSSFFGIMALSKIDPLWKPSDVHILEYQQMFEIESLPSAHPLHVNLTNGYLGRQIFDKTTYVKGNCVVNMIYHFLGELTFLSSVRRYIQTYYYRAADEQDLWNVFQKEITPRRKLPKDLTMKSVMQTWISQSGFPLLQVTRNKENGTITLVQERFYSFGTKRSAGTELWYIPVSWTTASNEQFSSALPKAWMLKDRMEINDTVLSQAIFSNRWILLNVNRTGLYPVNYDEENWSLLTASYDTLPQITKLQLLSDAFTIAAAGRLDYDTAWKILQKVRLEERDETMLKLVRGLLIPIKQRLWNSHVFKYAICALTDKVYRLEARNSTASVHWTRFKVDVMELACSMGHKACSTEARNYVAKILRNGTSTTVPVEFHTWAYCVYAKDATEEQWWSLLNKYRAAQAEYKGALAYALGCHGSATLLKRYLSLMTLKDASGTRDENYVRALTSVANNPNGLPLAMEIFTKLWNETQSNDQQCYTLLYALHAFASNMDQEEHVIWLRRLKSNDDKYGDTIEGLVNKVESNIAWNRDRRNETLRILNDMWRKRAWIKDCDNEGAGTGF